MNTSIVKQEERCSETADMASNVRENALEWVHVVRALRRQIVGGVDTRCKAVRRLVRVNDVKPREQR